MMQLAQRPSAQDGNLDLLVVYLPGLDIAQHTLLGGERRRAAVGADARVDALERYYGFLSDR